MKAEKITRTTLELDAVSGELQVMHNLLNIFANWFEETHKTDEVSRERTEQDSSRIWSEAPMYDSILCTLFGSISKMENEVNAVLDEQGKQEGVA